MDDESAGPVQMDQVQIYGNLVPNGNASYAGAGMTVFYLLGPLAFNGGPTPTHALLAGSPAIDKADPLNCPATDQRAVARPIDGDHAGGARCNIGAFEFQVIFPRLWLPLVER